jgi:hypothetical protein
VRWLVIPLMALIASAVARDATVVYAGSAAIRQVELREGRSMSHAERRVISEEGYVSGPYIDTKGNLTSGVGQTGAFRGMSFNDTFQHHALRASLRFPRWDDYTEELQAELIVAEYRGDLGQSPRTIRLITEERWREASVQFLRHDEYNRAGTSLGVKRRLERLSAMLLKQEVDS